MTVKIWGIILVVVLFLFVLLQNTQVVSMRFLFWNLSMSQIILLPLILVIGFIAGFIVGRVYKNN